MDIASVIVDVPAKQTDREFDYRIPEKWKAVIQAWNACHCPIWSKNGTRLRYRLKDKSEFEKLRNIKEPMDLEPVLNNELLTAR